jgi:hypothetical protein
MKAEVDRGVVGAERPTDAEQRQVEFEHGALDAVAAQGSSPRPGGAGSIRRECLDHVVIFKRAICAAFYRAIFNTIMTPERIFRSISPEICDLIRRMSNANPLWDAPRRPSTSV